MDEEPVWIKEVEGKQKMDALEFLKYAEKICDDCYSCEACPANKYIKEANCEDCMLDIFGKYFDAELAVEIVEHYSEANPIVTNQDKFLEVFPETELKRGFINICPRTVSKEYRSKSNEYGTCSLISLKHDCEQCEKEFWMSEAK